MMPSLIFDEEWQFESIVVGIHIRLRSPLFTAHQQRLETQLTNIPEKILSFSTMTSRGKSLQPAVM